MMAQGVPGGGGGSRGGAQKDLFDREVDFIEFLLDEALFSYANLAMEELRRAFPGEQDRIRVAEATVMLRQGRTQQVEELLGGMNLRTDDKARAILLQLAMTYDAMGQGDAAREKYNQFLEVIRGQDIDDPDVLRFFAGAAMRLAAILMEAGQFEQAAQAVSQVIESSEEDVIKRKFRILLIQTHLDHGLTLQGNARNAAFKKARDQINEILWGANDNYWFMAMAQDAWLNFLEGKTSEAMATLNDIRPDAQRLERQMEEAQVPKSEFPRAIMRYVRGLILFDAARNAHNQGDTQRARARAGEAASQLYNAFLLYEGNEYARRAGLKYEEVRVWIRDTYNIVINPGENVRDPAARETIFKRQLDLADELMRSNQRQEAERLLLNALSQYPMTRYTLGALNSLGRIWVEEERDWELITLAQYVADLYPDDSTAANMMLRWGQRMVQQENDFGIENILGAFGRNFPGHPRAPAMLFEIARRAQDQGDPETARRFYDEVIEYHPGSAVATRVLTLQAADALRSENFEEAVRVFTIVRDQAPPGFQRAQASLGIADAKLRSDDIEMRQEGLADLEALRELLQPSDDNPLYRGEDAERSRRLLRRVHFNIGQALIRQARLEDSDTLRERAVSELNSFLAAYPDDQERIPLVMHGLGRVYLQQGQFDRATQTFNALARDYPDSDVGRDALFSLVSAALEEEQIDVARDAVRRMIEQPDSYEPEQIFQVGTLMLENERYAEALSSFELVARSSRAQTDSTFGLRVALNMGRAAFGAENYERAVEVLGKLVEENPNSSLVVEAGIQLSQAHIQLEQFEAAERALQPVSRLLRGRQDPVGRAKLGIAAGNVSKAAGNSGVALIDYYSVALLEPASSEHRVLVQNAIHRALEIAVAEAEAGDRAKWPMVRELAVQHMQHFPADRRHGEMQDLQRRASANIQ
ncbi:MAG: tetratricopeptide repeat protein [Verrucomicrobia bacterium]|nr:tetratricopeptide repeat protein [Verrucomicrobiota bacterium]